jgi:hypothetical protein
LNRANRANRAKPMNTGFSEPYRGTGKCAKAGLVLVHHAKEHGGGQVFRAQRPGHHGGEDVEGGGFATAGLRNCERAAAVVKG